MLAVRTPNLAGSRACRHVVGRHHALPAAGGIKSVYLDGFATNLRRRRLAVDSRAVLSSATPATYGDQDPQLAYMQADSIEQPEATGWKAILASVGKAAGALALAVVLIMGTAAPALAARSGGRMGGSSFSSRSFSGPSTGGGYNYRYRSPNPSMRGSGTVMRTTGGVTFLPSFFFPMAPWGMGYGFGGGSTLLNLIFLAIAMWAVVSVARGIFADDGDTYEEEYYEDPKVAVGRVQVGLLGNARQLKRDLERMADGADTSSNTGLHYLLQETVLALQRNPEYCVYGYADGSVTRGLDKAETAFNELAMKERAKFKEETLVNVSGRRSQQEMSRGGGGVSELIVVTLLVAAEQPLRLPKVDSMATLQEALTKLGSVSADNLCALEILWTPQDDDDFYTSQQLMTDYPYLNNL